MRTTIADFNRSIQDGKTTMAVTITNDLRLNVCKKKFGDVVY